MSECCTSSYRSILAVLKKRLDEPAPGHIQMLIGPRQVGKTTLLLELKHALGDRSIYVSADSPESALPAWSERILNTAREQASVRSTVLLIDEVHVLPDWSRWLKSAYDAIKRESIALHIVATGSSSLKLSSGSKESMAGRFERLTLNHWGARDVQELLNISDQQASSRIVSHGGYPGAVQFWNDPPRWMAYLRDAIVEPAIGRDILQLEQVRKPALLRQVFALAAAHPAEIISLEKMVGSLSEKGAIETVAHYLHLLHQAYLVAPIQKYAASTLRRRRSPPKLVILNNALMVGASFALPPDAKTNPAVWGRWVENACLAHAINREQEVYYWREEPWEVDGVMIGSWGKWLVEIKTGLYSSMDLRGLAEATARFPGFTPVVLCDAGQEAIALNAGFKVKNWPEFLMNSLV